MSAARKAGTRRSPLVLTTAMAATLGTLSGCSSGNDWDDNYAATDTEICIDDAGYRISDWECDDDGYRRSYARSWYYVNSGSRLPYYGDRVLDPDLDIKGSRKARGGVRYARAPEAVNLTRSAAKARGGFGSSSGRFGSGRS